MSGKVPPSSGAGRRASAFGRARSPNVRRAALLYERFTGHEAQGIAEIEVPPLPAEVAVIGECDGVLYTTTRDGRVEHYKHDFAHGDKPLLCVSPDGRQLLMVGGNYLFTERGIVDRSDKKNWPRGRR